MFVITRIELNFRMTFSFYFEIDAEFSFNYLVLDGCCIFVIMQSGYILWMGGSYWIEMITIHAGYQIELPDSNHCDE